MSEQNMEVIVEEKEVVAEATKEEKKTETAKKPETKKEEKKAEEIKVEEPKKEDKPEEVKKEEVKKETKKVEIKLAEPKKEEVKKEEPKPAKVESSIRFVDNIQMYKIPDVNSMPKIFSGNIQVVDEAGEFIHVEYMKAGYGLVNGYVMKTSI